MNAVPIPDELAEVWYHGMTRVVVAAPSGRLDTDGSSPDEALPIEAMRGHEGEWPVFIEHWKPTEAEIEALKNGAILRLHLYVPQLVVHSLDVVPFI